MILSPLPPRVGDHGNQTERDIEKSPNEPEPLGSLVWPRRREVQPGERRRKKMGVKAQPPAMKGFNFTAGATRAPLAATHALQFGELARAHGFDFSLGLRTQFENIGQLSRNAPIDKFLDQLLLAGVILLGVGVGPDPLRNVVS